MSVTIEPTVAADLAAVTDQKLPGRIQALTVKRDGRVLGIGGLRFREDGIVFAFVAMAPGVTGKENAVTLHRAGLRMMREVRQAGLYRVLAEADEVNPAALRWLERLGFRPIDVDGCKTVFEWRR